MTFSLPGKRSTNWTNGPWFLVALSGLEPEFPTWKASELNQLFDSAEFNGHIWDSNPWRSACKADILPTELMAQILVLRPGFEPGLSDRKSDGLNRWPNGAYFVVPSSGVEPDFWDFQSRPFPRLDAMA